jgi:integrase
MGALREPTGHVFRTERARGAAWYAKYRLPDGRQVQKKIGPAWTERGRPPAGYFTKRTAEAWLRDVLDQARRGTLPGLVRTGATFADAAAEYMRYAEQDRGCKPSTLRDYRSTITAHLLPAFGSMAVEDIDARAVERWRAGLPSTLSPRTKNKLLIQLHGIFRRAQKVYGLPRNPMADVERHRQRSNGDIHVFSVEEVHALVRAAESEQDAAIFLTAAFTGLRRAELLALRWRDVDFDASAIRVRASYSGGALTMPKSGRVRSVPMAPVVGHLLSQLGHRERFTSDDDLVFAGELGGYLDGSALRRRYHQALTRAGLRSLRFHDLRHTFGTRMIVRADLRRVQEWMGHSDIQTTMKYLHYALRHDDAALVADAFSSGLADRSDGRVPWDMGGPKAGQVDAGEHFGGHDALGDVGGRELEADRHAVRHTQQVEPEAQE